MAVLPNSASFMKVLLADDHALFREGLCHVLSALNTDIVFEHAASISAALTIVKADDSIDLALLDIKMPDTSGLQGIELLRSVRPALPIVMVSASEDINDVRAALSLGANGFIGKNASASTMVGALRLVLAGEIYVPPSVLANAYDDQKPSLTVRQHGVLKLMDEGLTNKGIAEQLAISEATVKMHITAIFRALNVSNRTQAVKKAQALRLLT